MHEIVSTKLLSYASRIQLIRSVNMETTNYWMQHLPFPKKVIQNIDVLYRSFLWSGGNDVTNKSLVQWKHACALKAQCGLNLISLEEWNKENLDKLL